MEHRLEGVVARKLNERYSLASAAGSRGRTGVAALPGGTWSSDAWTPKA